ncbi:hypothetical protein [Falsiroseomonas oryzae]|uniref:hypothetical protein n=1 Tax=Falsiroseomonas oryzae TaxID=2766473 RepID=UPI0022EADE88|nr:hypothetical protein [Roseomonas sp. MO-31]
MAQDDRLGRWDGLLRALPAIGGIGALLWLFAALMRDSSSVMTWPTLAKAAAAVGIAFGVAALLRYALGPLTQRRDPPVMTTGTDSTRDRLAWVVLAIGSAAIAALALGLVIAFTQLVEKQVVEQKIDALLMGVFTAVLPVFATWVGTVIAFYFTNESFRQAAQSAREAAQGVAPQLRVTDRMIAYDKVAKIEEERAQARTVPMERIVGMFNDNTTRVIVFDKTKQPVFVLRRKSPPLPPTWTSGSADIQGKTIDDYLKENGGANAKDAAQFGFVAESATLDAARVELLKSNSDDLFVTATGQKTEPVIGWLSGDRLK